MLSTNRLSQSKSKSPSEVRLVEVLDAYLAAVQEGNAPARDVLLAEHPELAEDLEACLASLEFIRQASLTAPLLAGDSKAVETAEGEAGIGDLGDFRLIAEVGRGGMGVVYEAVQRSLNRRVALKVLPFAAAMDPTQLRRFQTEALAAAQLHHTNIVPVYSVGCERGVHYYAMQFIEGQTLAQAIADRRRLEEPPRPSLRRDDSSPPRRGSGFRGKMGSLGGPVRAEKLRLSRRHHRRAAVFVLGRWRKFLLRKAPKAGSSPRGEGARRAGDGAAQALASDAISVPERPASGHGLRAAEPADSGPTANLAGCGSPDSAADRARRGSPDPAGTADRRSPISVDAATSRRSTGSVPSSPTREYFRTAAALGIQAALALDHAHKFGIVHRDIKPANLLLDVQGNLWVTDFGLARLQDDAGLTITGDLLGTLRYMSPEQALAKRRYLDHRTDIYSLGVTLYELVTLRPAIDGQDRQEVLRRIAQDEPAAPRRLNPAIPRELETVLIKAMNKEPELRYATAQALADDLRRFLDDKPIRARRPTWFEHVVKWSRRHRLVVATAGLVLVLATVGLAIGMALLAREQSRTQRQRDIAQAKTREALEKAESLERQLYVNMVNRAKAEWSDGNAALADHLLDACPHERRGWEWYFNKNLCHSDLRTLHGHKEMARGVAFDASGRLVASVASSLDGYKWSPSELMVWEAATGRMLFARPGPHLNCVAFIPSGHVAVGEATGVVTFYDVATGDVAHTLGTRGSRAVSRIAVSGDGATLAVVRDRVGLELWDVRTGRRLHQVATSTRGWGVPLAFSPDGETLASSIAEASVDIWDAHTAKRIRTLRGLTGEVYAVAFSRKGDMIASGEWNGTVRTWESATGKPLLVLRGHQSFVHGVAFSPDGAHLASGAEDNSVKIWELSQGREVSTFNGHTNSVIDVAYAPDGKTLASASQDKTVKLWDATASPMGRVLTHGQWVTCVAFSHDGARVATAARDGLVRLFDPADGRTLLTLRHCSVAAPGFGAVHGVAFAPDDRALVSAGYDKTVRIWDAESGAELHVLRGHKNFIQGVAFAPDGRTVASVELGKALRTWDAASGAPKSEQDVDDRFAYAVVYSPDGRLLATAGASGWLRLWDAATLRLVRQLPAADYYGGGDQGRQVAFSPDSRRVVCPYRVGDEPGEVRVWDVATGRALLILRGHTSNVNGVAYSADGMRIATASSDRSVRIWDAATGDELTALRGHNGAVLGVDFDPSGRRLATTSVDFTARIWDAPRETQEGTP